MTVIVEDKYIPFGVLDTQSHDGNRYNILPYGDYVKLPDIGEVIGVDFYNFLVVPMDGIPRSFIGGTIGDVNPVLATAIKDSKSKNELGEYTLYYPISLC